MEDLLAKQAKEKQELVKQQTTLRKTIANAPKKEKKDIKAKIEDMEADLKRTHASQIVESNLGALSIDDVVKEEVPTATKDLEIGQAQVENGSVSMYANNKTGKEPSRQQKRKMRKAEEERLMRAEAKAEAALMPDLKAQEQEKIDALLEPLCLSIKQIPATGNCLYLSVLDQIKSSTSQMELRKIVSDHIRENQDDYIPFLELDLEGYLDALERKAAWGGHVEILAISRIYGRDVEVWKSDGPLRVGDNETGDAGLIRVSFHRHYFGLGEHYNSLHSKS